MYILFYAYIFLMLECFPHYKIHEIRKIELWFELQTVILFA